jgi:hypothetical protein
MRKQVAAIALVLAGIAGEATPASAAMVTQTTISGYTSSGFDFDLFELPDIGGPYSLVFRQQFPAPDLDSIPDVNHSRISGPLFQVTFNYAGRSWDWFDIYQPGIPNFRHPREVVYWRNASETLSTKDPFRNLQFYFESGIEQFIRTGQYYGVTGALDMSNVSLPMTFIDWSSGYPVGEIAIYDLDIDVVGFYTLDIQCFYDGCPGARSDATGLYRFRSDIRHVKVESFALPGTIPEPASWAMLVTGFGLVGSALRRRTRVTA